MFKRRASDLQFLLFFPTFYQKEPIPIFVCRVSPLLIYLGLNYVALRIVCYLPASVVHLFHGISIYVMDVVFDKCNWKFVRDYTLRHKVCIQNIL